MRAYVSPAPGHAPGDQQVLDLPAYVNYEFRTDAGARVVLELSPREALTLGLSLAARARRPHQP